LSKNKLTNKEITGVLGELSQNDQYLLKEIVEIKQAFALYLEHRKEAFNEDVDGFNEFVKGKVKEFEQQRSKNKEGA
jgi:hypothetical protein